MQLRYTRANCETSPTSINCAVTTRENQQSENYNQENCPTVANRALDNYMCMIKTTDPRLIQQVNLGKYTDANPWRRNENSETT
eukprot:4975042-Amphidinium_carterae.1